jgi:hypothetical protein
MLELLVQECNGVVCPQPCKAPLPSGFGVTCLLSAVETQSRFFSSCVYQELTHVLLVLAGDVLVPDVHKPVANPNPSCCCCMLHCANTRK